MKKRFVITGIGPVSSIGIGKANFWWGALKQQPVIEKIHSVVAENESCDFFMHKIIDFDLKEYGISKTSIEYINKWKENKPNRDLELMIVATKLALEDAGINYLVDNPFLSLIVSHENPCLEQFIRETYEKFSFQNTKNFSAIFNETVKTGYETQSFMLLFHLARTFNVHNYSLVINNACASGLYGLEAAADLIKVEKAKQVAVIVGDSPDVYKYLWFKLINMYDDNGKLKAFSKDTNGFVIGEGASCLILEDYEYAIQRKAHIYAEYVGGGFSLESWGVTTPRIGDNCLHECIEQALKNSKIDKGGIDLICAHGAGTISSDYYEGKAIMDIFSNITPVTSFKAYLGHTLGASALLELSLLILSMTENEILPILNTVHYDERLKINFVHSVKKKDLNYCLKLCNAFAGYNAAVILKKI